MHVDLAGPAGILEALLDVPPAAPRAAVVLAHADPEQGGSMHNRVVFEAAKAFGRLGCAVLRFNFRGVGRSAGSHDGGRGERLDMKAALDAAADRFPGVPLWAAGYSFGAWMAMTEGARHPRVTALVGIAPPVDRDGFEAVAASPIPKFFIAAERDEVVPLGTIRRFYASAVEPRELVVIDTADHVFDGLVTELGAALEDLLGDFDNPDDRRAPARGGARGEER